MVLGDHEQQREPPEQRHRHRDITDEFFTEDAYEEQTINIVEEVVVPQPPDNPSGNGGFQPGVEDWDEENIPIAI